MTRLRTSTQAYTDETLLSMKFFMVHCLHQDTVVIEV